jgi:predicted Zn finger-like uncharacterized protein
VAWGYQMSSWRGGPLNPARRAPDPVIRSSTVGIGVGMPKPPPSPVYCPSCHTQYRVVRAEAGPETTTDGEIPCKTCGAPMHAREGAFILKYFRVASPKRAAR